jgi:sugar phosphate isomerase/epimerase
MERLSCCTFPLQALPLAQALPLIAAAGFKRVDVLGKPPHLELGPGAAAGLNAAATASGLAVVNLGTYAGRGFAEPGEAEQIAAFDELCAAVDLAAALGARSIRVMAGDDTTGCLDRIAPWFRRGAAYAEGAGVYLGFENHGGAVSVG